MYSLTPVLRFELKQATWQPIYLTTQQVFDLLVVYKQGKRNETEGKVNEWIISNHEGYYIEGYIPFKDEPDQMMMIYFHPANAGTVTTVHIDNDSIESFIGECQKIIDWGWKKFLDNRNEIL